MTDDDRVVELHPAWRRCSKRLAEECGARDGWWPADTDHFPTKRAPSGRVTLSVWCRACFRAMFRLYRQQATPGDVDQERRRDRERRRMERASNPMDFKAPHPNPSQWAVRYNGPPCNLCGHATSQGGFCVNCGVTSAVRKAA